MGNRRRTRDDEAVDDSPSTFELVRRFGPPGVLVVAALLFVLQNPDATRFDFLWFQFEWPLWVMLVAFSLVGAAVFWFLARRRRKSKEA